MIMIFLSNLLILLQLNLQSMFLSKQRGIMSPLYLNYFRIALFSYWVYLIQPFLPILFVILLFFVIFLLPFSNLFLNINFIKGFLCWFIFRQFSQFKLVVWLKNSYFLLSFEALRTTHIFLFLKLTIIDLIKEIRYCQPIFIKDHAPPNF